MLQPYLHELVSCVTAPATWLSAPSGQVSGGADGLYASDRRLLSRLEVTVDGQQPVPIYSGTAGAGRARFVGVLRQLGDDGPDPTVTCVRERETTGNGGRETITIENRSRRAIDATVEVHAAADLVPMGIVKQGGPDRPHPLPAATTGSGFVWRCAPPDTAGARLTAAPPPATDPAAGRLSWTVKIDIGASWSATLAITALGPPPQPVARRPAPLSVTAADRRLGALVAHGVDDLTGLLLADGDDRYYAAGSPWFLTLFGRDSLWTARLALPLGTDPAVGTVRLLARRQGQRRDPRTEEEPGKILHEVRPPDAAVFLPPVYYGTVDATPLFVSTLAEAWRWGVPPEQVRPLLPAVRRALRWLGGHEDFIAYAPSGPGLVNQGWKDSSDGVQYADGRLANPPVSLCEVQGYAYRAAIDGAALLEALDGDGAGAAHWRDWAASLADRFREAFWVRDANGRYPAIALDGTGRAVDGPASNMGHLIGTGLLDAGEEALVARLLSGPAMSSGYGLRTLSANAAGYNPISYHAGSVWPHDTVIAVLGLARAGHFAAAAELTEGLLAAGRRFDYRLPELFGGDAGALPYPAACRPQAWAAAVGPALVTALLGLAPDVPSGRLTLRPVAPSPVGPFRVSGLRVAGGTLDVSVSADGTPTVHSVPSGVECVV